MKRLFILTILAISSLNLRAQDAVLRAEIEARVDYMQEFRSSENYGPGSGFKADTFF